MKILLPLLVLFTFAFGSIYRVEEVADGRILARILDESTDRKGDVVFWYGNSLTSTRAEIVDLDPVRGYAVLRMKGASPRPGDLFLDRDWFVAISLLDMGGDIEKVGGFVKDLPGSTAFASLHTNSLEGFKVLIDEALTRRTEMVEKAGRPKDRSSLAFLRLARGDYFFRYESDWSRALSEYRKGIESSASVGGMQARALEKMGDASQNLRRPSDAAAYWTKSAEIMDRLGMKDAAESVRRKAASALKAKPEAPAPESRTSDLRSRIVATSRGLLGTVWTEGEKYLGRNFLYDCQGTVAKVAWAHGIDITRNYDAPGYTDLLGGVPRIFKTYLVEKKVHFSKRPRPGDMVFFDNTWDYNGNGRWDDTFTHIGLVEEVDADGTISVIHHCSRGIMRYKMNLERPTVYQDESGKVLNSFIRRQNANDPAGTSYVLGTYFSGFASLE